MAEGAKVMNNKNGNRKLKWHDGWFFGWSKTDIVIFAPIAIVGAIPLLPYIALFQGAKWTYSKYQEHKTNKMQESKS
jgi:hypothetical protein